MKLQTEIIREVLVITCVDSRLDASIAPIFFKSIQSCIQKGHLYIVLDLSSVDFVDSAGLGALVHVLQELSGKGQFVLFGAGKPVLSLLKMTRLDAVFIQAQDKNRAIELVLFEKKCSKEQQPANLETAHTNSSKKKASVTMQEVASGERRKYQRIGNKQILDDDIIVYCTNTGTGKRSTAVVLNISPGGLFLVSPSTFQIDDEFLIEGAVGKNFKFKELAIVRSVVEGKYGMEFIKPSAKTTQFLHQLTGSVILRKYQTIA